ncbi:MAG: poly(A) polymerase [Deltaproteobacteria bacterium]|jgi:poly(A) polymerase|nr:poly(A) polymerase [Deltaproteobacteria bacterium]
MPTSPGTGSKLPENNPKPRIIPRSEHPISRKNIDREALKVMYRLRDTGFTAYLVGGGVRDLYLGEKPKDFDISTNAKPGQLRKIFKNSRLIGRRFRLVQVFFHGGKIIEVSTFRCRSEYDLNGDKGSEETVLASNNTFGSPSDDAFRRDLTINGLFYEIENFTIIDYTDGVNDLNKGIIRLIGEPNTRIQRDPARMLRVIRHAARNNFTIDRGTWQAVIDHKKKLNLCPISRIRDELMKDLRSTACRNWAELVMESGILYVIVPFYRDVLDPPENNQNRRLFLAIQACADRLHAKGIKMPDQLLFSLLLTPWAIAEFDLLKKNLKGAEFSRFLKTIRASLDEILGHMSIKRSNKESIALHMATLPQFMRFAKENRWPKWLKKKSYYRECDLFFRIFSEATGSKKIPNHVVSEASKYFAGMTKLKPARKRRYKNRGRHGPAFSGKKRGSIFGLKK